MNKTIVALLIMYVAAIPVRACDAIRTTIAPGVSWCKGCCENEGYSWIEVRGKSCLHHRDIVHNAGGLILLLGSGTVAAGIAIKKESRESTTKPPTVHIVSFIENLFIYFN